MAEVMVWNASNQKTDATSKNQLFEYYNFALHTQDDSCTLNALKMHLVFGSGVSAPAWNVADARTEVREFKDEKTQVGFQFDKFFLS